MLMVLLYCTLGAGLLIGALVLWARNRPRLKRLEMGTETSECRAGLFEPTHGNLQITRLYPSWIERALKFLYYVRLTVLAALILFGLVMLVISLAMFAIILFQDMFN